MESMPKDTGWPAGDDSWRGIPLLDLGAEALEVCDGRRDEVGGFGEHIHFDAAIGSGEGEIGAAE